MYRPIVYRKEDSKYPPTLKTKISLQHVRCWSPEGEPIPAASVDWKASRLAPIVQISKLWMISRMVGITLDVTDVVVHPSEASVCPFLLS